MAGTQNANDHGSPDADGCSEKQREEADPQFGIAKPPEAGQQEQRVAYQPGDAAHGIRKPKLHVSLPQRKQKFPWR